MKNPEIGTNNYNHPPKRCLEASLKTQYINASAVCLLIVGPKYSNIPEAHERELKTNFMKLLEVLKEEMNGFLKETLENT